MARYVLLFHSNAKRGRDAEFTSWNEREGMPGILRIKGFTSAERFVLNDGSVSDTNYPFRYMDAYDVETDDIESVVRQIKERQKSAKSDGVTDEGTVVTVFKPLGPRLRA
jgi:hypothetical protein